MKAPIQSFVAAMKTFAGNRITKGMGLLLTLLYLPAALFAQDVPYALSGVGWAPGGPYYSDDQRYVVWQSDFGFFTLDTQTLTAAHVQAENKCGFSPPAASNFYLVGDCNGIGSVRTSGGLVEVKAAGGNCSGGKHDQGCSGSLDYLSTFFFGVGGNWVYQGDHYNNDVDIPNGTKTSDSVGRTWVLQPISPGHFNWHAVGNPNAPPTASATAVNLSAAGRTDKSNYFGDQWTLTDGSSAITAIDTVQWSFLNNGTWDATNTISPPATNPTDSYSFPFPCAASSISTPANCYASLGASPGSSFKFALQAHNTNGWSTPPFVSSAITVNTPQIRIAGFSGTVLNILTGGVADATGTQGNIAGSTFAWQFTPSGTSSLQAPVVPSGTTAFSLAVTYPDGYQANAAGSVNQVDLVPAFTVAPNPILLNANLTLTNKMQIGAPPTSLTSVDYVYGGANQACGSTWPGGGTLVPGGFNSVNGTAAVAAPGSVGTYCLYLNYNYNDHNGRPQSILATNTFSAINWTPSPQIAISPNPNCLPVCGLLIGTNYNLSDGETLQQPEDAKWELVSNGSTTWSTTSGNANTAVTFSPTAATACASNCFFRLTVPSTGPGVTTQNVTISTQGGGGGGNLSVSISGPTTLPVGQSGTFIAGVSGGSGSINYSWLFDDQPIPVSGGSSMAHAWSSAGSHNVTLSVTQGSKNGSAVHAVTVTGQPAPSGAFTITPSQVSGTTYTVGATQLLTFTASELNAAQWGWDFGDGTAAGGAQARSVQKIYAAQGTYNCTLIVYADGVHNSGITQVFFTVVAGVPLPSPVFTVTGATPDGSAFDTEVGHTLTFTAQEQNASVWSWNFGDGTSGVGQVVTKAYSAAATETVTLSVTGDGVNNGGTTSSTMTVNVNPSTFHAMIVPGVAHLDDGTTTWGTDVSVTNGGVSPLDINLAFLGLLPDASAPPTMDLSQLNYGNTITVVPGGTYSVAEVVTALNGGNNKGTLVVEYSGGDAPLVSTRVYFAPKVNPNNIAYGSGLPAYQVDATGQISPQGYISTSLNGSGNSTSVSTQSVQAVENVTLTVNFAGTGSGSVASNPSGLSCNSGSPCSASFTNGTPVTISGSAATGSVFVGITGCDSYPIGTCAVNLTSNKTVTATFNATAPPPPPGSYSLTVTKGGTGTGSVTSNPAGISCGATCSSSFTSGTAVTLTAGAGTGSSFAGWSGGGCSGTGTCTVTLSANTSVAATFNTSTGPPPPTTQGDQELIGLRSDPRYRFGVTLYNAAGSTGTFRLSAVDEGGSAVLISDGLGGQVAYRDFTVRPYQQIYLKSDDIGLNDVNKRYVLKGQRTSPAGTLLAFGTALDRKTNDFIQITDDSQASTSENGIVSYWVAGVSRYDTTYGAHWRTDLRIYNRGSSARNLYFEYTFLSGGTEHVAHVSQVSIGPADLLTYDDVIATLMSQDASVNLTGSNSGFLRIYYPEDAESATRPLIIGSRNFDDQTTGTAGSQLALYTHNQAANTGQKLVLSGAQESAQYTTKIGVFLMDPGPVALRISAVGADGTEIGSLVTSLGNGAHWGQISLADLPNFVNPNVPVSIKIDSISGGRVGAYAFTVDKTTLDTTFIQALPQ
jgi:hypothetical protein